MAELKARTYDAVVTSPAPAVVMPTPALHPRGVLQAKPTAMIEAMVRMQQSAFHAELMAPPPPVRKFQCISADPAWAFSDRGTRMSPDYAGSQRAALHYPVMNNADIIALGELVKRIAADNAHLWLWCPNSLVVDGTGQKVIESWGFKGKQIVPWLKTSQNGMPRLGGGHWSRCCTEMLLFATRGSLKSQSHSIPGVLLSDAEPETDDVPELLRSANNPAIVSLRLGHSVKPNEQYTLIEAISPGPRIELFARRTRAQWTPVGNEIDGKDIRDALPAIHAQIIADAERPDPPPL